MKRWLLILFVVAALAGCGRKGPLELPATAEKSTYLTAVAVAEAID